ncbi:MAG: hypothetical protein PWQ37_1732 [Candidatus Petromonas sp.]|jgi:hypothetical protein|nr:hypothetical protein [Candidatus Petromonas sp.]
MTRLKMKIMMEGLIATAVEKINVLGWEEAKKDVEKIVDMVEDLEMFWNPDGELTENDWSFEIASAIEKARES